MIPRSRGPAGQGVVASDRLGSERSRGGSVTNRRFGVRGVLSLGVALVAVAAMAALGGVGLAGGATKPSTAQSQDGSNAKVTLCHKGKVTIRVSVNARPAHRAHGDVEGACATARANAKAKAKAKDEGKAKGKSSSTTEDDEDDDDDDDDDTAKGRGNGNDEAKGKS